MQKSGSLTGIKVLDLSRMLPGPYCSMILADHGADVIAIEDRRFQSDDLFFSTVNRNKKHLSLNLKSAEGKEIFDRLAVDADVIIEGFRPGVVERLGVDYASIKKINPAVVYCSITGFGQDGPERDRPGHDVNYMSMSGLLDLIGPRKGPPVIPGIQFADIAGGSMNAVTGILLALFVRTRTGVGQFIDISMTDGMVGYLSLPHFFSMKSGSLPCRSDDLLSHRYACYNTYETADNRFVAIGAVEKRFWTRLCEILGVPEYSGLQYNDDRREECIAMMSSIFKSETVAHWDELLSDEDVCYSRVLTYEEVLNSDLFRLRSMVVENGNMTEFGIPVKLSETPGSVRHPAVGFGGSNTSVLQELGYDEEQIIDLKARKII